MIVLVDDNPAHRLLVKRAVRKVLPQMELCELSSYLQGLSFLASSGSVPPTLFLVDLNLGDGRGTDLTREIKNRWKVTTPPVLLLSTSDLEEDRLDAEQAGVSQYVLKQDDPIQFGEQITDLLTTLFGLISEAPSD